MPRLRERHVFWSAWLRSPLKVGAIAPSGPFLANAMASYVDPHRPGWVIELGAGNGVVTHALLQAGVKMDRLLIIERDRRMCGLLRKRFPDAKVVQGDAADLVALMQEHHVHKVSAIVSSLPLLVIPKPICDQIVSCMLEALPEDGVLVQFTYGSRSSIRNRQLKRHHAHVASRYRVWLNVPPATVWCYKKNK